VKDRSSGRDIPGQAAWLHAPSKRLQQAACPVSDRINPHICPERLHRSM
jgi:hypothetical protein